MRRIICIILALLLLAGCRQNEVQEESPVEVTPVVVEAPPLPEPPPAAEEDAVFQFTRENFPVLDGSTSTVPLAKAAAAVLLGEDAESVDDLIQFHKTTESYRRLMNGSAEVLLAAEPADAIWEEKESQGVEWCMEPFALDGLIFVVSADNPVDSLTVAQVQKLYTGEITNWKDVGGGDVPVTAFQRNAEAGSQTMMNKLVMDGLDLMQPPMEQVVETMYGLMEAVRGFDGSAGAIGYSVYYYASDMRMAEGLKILQIEGVEPSAEHFRDGSYPFVNPYYVLRLPDDRASEGARVFFDWMLGAEGQRLAAEMGYAAANPAGSGALSVQVAADWSRLPMEDLSERVVRRSPERVETLTPADDYGVLVPFAGEELTVDPYGNGGWSHYRYGLADAQGRIVVDPVYDGVEAARDWLSETYLPVYILRQGDPDAGEYGQQFYGLAAMDGSWCTEIRYQMAAVIGPEELVLVDQGGDAWLCDLEGELTDCGFGGQLKCDTDWEFLAQTMAGPWAELWLPDGQTLVNFHTGKLLPRPENMTNLTWVYGDGLVGARDQSGHYGYLGEDGTWVIPPRFYDINPFIGGYALVSRDTMVGPVTDREDDGSLGSGFNWDHYLIDREGDPVLSTPRGLSIFRTEKGIFYEEFSSEGLLDHLYDAALAPQDSRLLGKRVFGNSSVWQDAQGREWLWDGETDWPLPEIKAAVRQQLGTQVLLDSTSDNRVQGVYDAAAGTWIVPMEIRSVLSIEACRDALTGEVYWTQHGDDGRTDVYNSQGKWLYANEMYPSIAVGGLHAVMENGWGGIVDRDGQWLLRVAVSTEE